MLIERRGNFSTTTLSGFEKHLFHPGRQQDDGPKQDQNLKDAASPYDTGSP